MNAILKPLSRTLALALAAFAFQAHAQVRITEVAPWASTPANAPYATDWFELTNMGTSAVNISGWKMDDSSPNFATTAVALTGITSIAAGESVIFTENPATASFLSTWFGANVPAGLQVGNYTGSGVGLSTTADEVNIFDSTGTLQAKVTFGASNNTTAPFLTFDNAAGLNGVAISALSTVGINGAFQSASGPVAIGSPGAIANPIPEPETYAMLLAGLALLGGIARKRQSK